MLMAAAEKAGGYVENAKEEAGAEAGPGFLIWRYCKQKLRYAVNDKMGIKP